MNKNIFYVISVVVLFFAMSGILYHKTFIAKNETALEYNALVQDEETAINETQADGDIVEISVDTVKGITQREAEELCYYVLGEKDEDTGFSFSFGTSGAVEKDRKQYYVIRASWLVDNNHLSYIGDFFVSADGKEIYNGTARPDEYIMLNIIWSE
jgi:hypothetical protein